MNDEIKMPKVLYYLFSSDISFALTNSLLLFNFYKEITGKNDNMVKITEHFSKLVNDIELFYLLEIDNTETFNETFNENMYKINNKFSVLTTIKKNINTIVREPNNSNFIGNKNIRDCKLIINSTQIDSINNFKYKHIKCNLQIL